MKQLTKWRMIIGNTLFAIAVGYFYFRPDVPQSFRIIVFVLLVGVLITGTINEYKLKVNKE